MMPATGWTATAVKAAITGLLLLLTLTGCAWSGSEFVPQSTSPEAIPPVPAPGESTIVYLVEGTGTAAVNYMTVQAGTVVQESISGTTLPFTKSMTVTRGGGSAHAALTLVAVGNDNTDTISCTITEDGTVVAEQTATGPFAAVTCTFTRG